MSDKRKDPPPVQVPGGWLQGRLVLRIAKPPEGGERQLLLCGKGSKWDVRASLGTESGNVSLFREQVRAGIQVALSGRMQAMLSLLGQGVMDNSHTQRYLSLTDHILALMSESSVSAIAARLKSGEEVEIWKPVKATLKAGDAMSARLAEI